MLPGLCLSLAVSPEKSNCSRGQRKAQGSTFWAEGQRMCPHVLWEMTLSFLLEVSRMQSPFSKHPAILGMGCMHRGGCNLLPPISTVKFEVGAGGEGKSKYLTSFQVTSIQVQDCLLAWFLILVLVSRLVRHYLLAVYFSLCLSLQ